MSRSLRCAASGATVEVEHIDGDTIVTSTVVSVDLPIFAGHYPGFPIFPGVCLIDCAHHSVVAAAQLHNQELSLDSVESTRFLSPVFPGDRIETRIRVANSKGRRRCSATLSTGRGPAAEVRLLYRLEGQT